MKVKATMNAGYSPYYGFEIVEGKEYDIPDQENPLPEFFAPVKPPKAVADPPPVVASESSPAPDEPAAPAKTKGGAK